MSMFNIEIKARIENLEETEQRAKEISDTGEKTVIVQTDTFFNVLNSSKNGRFKLRQFEDGSGVLIYYERPDREGPKMSDYSTTYFNSQGCKEIYNILSASNGIIGEVKKVRHLYMVGQTRIHIDRVSGLGDFVELEVVLPDKSEMESGTKICNEVMEKLGIKKDNLVSGAYFDLLLQKM